MNPLPPNILKCMSAKDRQPLGRAGATQPEIDEKQRAESERELQNQIAGWLTINEIFFIRNRMDKRPTVIKGLPDFVIILPPSLTGITSRCVMIEAKMEGKEPSDDQNLLHDRYERQAKNKVPVVTTLEQVILIVRRLLDL